MLTVLSVLTLWPVTLPHNPSLGEEIHYITQDFSECCFQGLNYLGGLGSENQSQFRVPKDIYPTLMISVEEGTAT